MQTVSPFYSPPLPKLQHKTNLVYCHRYKQHYKQFRIFFIHYNLPPLSVLKSNLPKNLVQPVMHMIPIGRKGFENKMLSIYDTGFSGMFDV